MLTEVLTELEARRKDREADFLKLARKLAAGDKVTTATVERLLADTGKTPDELTAAVELATQRFAWHAERQAADALEKEQAAIRDRIAAEDRKLTAAEQAHEEATAPLRDRLHKIRAAVSAANDARRKLIKTCPYAPIKAEMKALTDRLNELRGQVAALRERGELVKRAERDEETADRLQAGIVPFANTAHIDRLREQAERHRKAGKDALAALATVQKEIAKLEREEAAIFERMTKPRAGRLASDAREPVVTRHRVPRRPLTALRPCDVPTNRPGAARRGLRAWQPPRRGILSAARQVHS